MRISLRRLWLVAGCSLPLCLAEPSQAQKSPSAADALRLTPVQRDVDFDRPDAAAAAKCTIAAETSGGLTGWVVRDDAGLVLRRFLDTNGDNKVDQWCYYRDGIEVYRDIDADFKDAAEECRWLGTAGMRWGVDRNGDGQIDAWRVISAEEATEELVSALRDQDKARFDRLLLTAEEIESLGLSEEKARELQAKVDSAKAKFLELARKQTLVAKRTEWINFGAVKPGVIPAGQDGSKKDLWLYDNVTAVVETEGKHGQLLVGSVVKAGDCWKLIDLPASLAGDATANNTAAAGGSYFFHASLERRASNSDSPASPMGVSPEVQKLVVELQKIDKSLETAGRTELARLHDARCDLLERLAAATSGSDQGIWIRQYADTVSAAVQAGAFPGGVRRLEGFLAKLDTLSRGAEHAAFVNFRVLSASYNLSLQNPEAKYEEIHKKWIANLEEFISKYASNPDTAEAMLQLAIAYEFSGKDDEAAKMFGRVAKEYAQEEVAKKAAGAQRRLESVGQKMELSGQTLDGRKFSLAGLSGDVVLVHYWATWCEPCKQDMQLIREMQNRYAKSGFTPVGVNLDASASAAAAYVRDKRLPWAHLYEEGGLESRFANEMGILSLPTMILLDSQGRIVNRNIHAAELETELKKLLKK